MTDEQSNTDLALEDLVALPSRTVTPKCSADIIPSRSMKRRRNTYATYAVLDYPVYLICNDIICFMYRTWLSQYEEVDKCH